MRAYYIICFILISVISGYFLFKKKRETSSLYTVIFVVTTISSLGYMMLALSSNESEALLANKISYLGGIFIPCLTFMILCDYLKYKQFKLVVLIGALFAFILYAVILSNTKLYYKDVTFDKNLGVAYFKSKVYGPVHGLYYVYVGLCIILDLVALILSFKKQSVVSIRCSIYFTLLVCTSLLSAFVSKMFYDGFELMPAVYVLDGILLLIVLSKMTKYNLSYAYGFIDKNKDFAGYFIIDENYVMLGSNNLIKEEIEEFKYLKIDRVIPNDGFFDGIWEFIEEFNKSPKNNTINHSYNNKSYRIKILDYNYKEGKNGYLFIVTDDTEQSNYINLIEGYAEVLEDKVNEKTKDIAQIRDRMVLGMASVVESRDLSTGGHVRRTSEIMEIIIKSIKKTKAYELDEMFYEYLKRSAPLHDIGKISISDLILNKPGRYTDSEYEIMKNHAAMGEKLVYNLLNGVENNDFVMVAKNVAGHHHEKYDGSGYPSKLKGDDIPVEARIMALADVYDALVSERCYKPKYTFEEAHDIIVDMMGTQFDPRLKDVFLDCEFYLINYYKVNS